VKATHGGDSYRTVIDVTKGVGADRVVIGHTLPRGTQPATVVLDGKTIHKFQVRQTNRGTEVTVSTTSGHHTLTVTA